ncbi:Type I inositol 1 4 5-trisphosphate 5-phosphatase 2 [Fusarium beomiforme]|uniref:Type I inositol 1 4 5-trisphosphate 5-phosphatase 2 n=1 Tax=Fusarium beomiforme TaxID=44412 RepID=A0A9P5A3L1_9HYPO|nr:Type I inositol 1 4 5-trisphosphate 5-phosphatase 2 [Fusarium beomiforme]
MRRRRENPQCSIACNYCRAKKARSGRIRARIAHKQECTFPGLDSRAAKRRNTNWQLEERLKHMEQRLDQLSATPPSNNRPSTAGLTSSHPRFSSNEEDGELWQSGRMEALLTPSASTTTNHGADFGAGPLGDDTTTQHDLNRPQRQSILQSKSTNTNSIVAQVDRRSFGSETQPRPSASQPLPLPGNTFPNPYRERGMSSQSAQVGSATTTTFSPRKYPQPPNCGSFSSSSLLFPQSADTNRSFANPWWNDTCENEPAGNTEHHGASSYMSICSSSGSGWISQRLGSSTAIQTSIRRLALQINKDLKFRGRFSKERTPDPPQATAREWVTDPPAFFEESLEHSMGLVQRPWFEARFEAHLANGARDSSDFAWSMTRDGTPKSFVSSRERSWSFFENAMSVHTELLYTHTDSTAIEALLLMVRTPYVFNKTLASPALEYMLVSSAVRLAQSKGFHIQASQESILSENERATRTWLWWNAYLLDKHVAIRSGRPSAVDDQDISVALPTVARAGTTSDFHFFKAMINHAQISSQVSRRLSTTRLQITPLHQTLQDIRDLDHQIREWYEDLDPVFKSRPSAGSRRTHPFFEYGHYAYLYFNYHGTLCNIHCILTYPWARPALLQPQNQVIAEQLRESSLVVSEASRAIARGTQHIDLDVDCRGWLALYYPIMSLVNLFLGVLEKLTEQDDETVTSDLILMDVLAGHFSRLEYATDSMTSITFAREVASLAREARAQERIQTRPSLDDPVVSLEGDGTTDFLVPANADELNNGDATEAVMAEWPFAFPGFIDITFSN